MPALLQLPQTLHSLLFRVLKFHLSNHSLKCFNPLALNFTPEAGWTDDEGIEQIWVAFNKVTLSTLMMTMGHQQDTLDDFCNHFNWQRTVQLDKSFLWNKCPKYRCCRFIITQKAYTCTTWGYNSPLCTGNIHKGSSSWSSWYGWGVGKEGLRLGGWSK